MIRLDQQSIELLCANQVIVDICSCIKELIENSIDANATNIDITLFQYGKNEIEVQDNGTGISQIDLQNIASKGSTSKLLDFKSLQDINTFGFRGEALNSIKNVSELTIITRQKQNELGQKLTFRNNFNEITQDINCEAGTRVIVKNLFSQIPVRRIEFEKNIKTQYNKLIYLVQEYSLIMYKIRIRIYNVNNQRELILNSGEASQDVKEKMKIIMGSRYYNECVEFNHNFDISFGGELKLKGYVSKKIESGSSFDSQWIKNEYCFCYINNRPIDPFKGLLKIFKEIYKNYNDKGRFFFVLIFEIDNDKLDFNLSPNKREIMFENEQKILQSLRESLIELHSKINSLIIVATQKRKSEKQSENLDQQKKIIQQDSILINNKHNASQNNKSNFLIGLQNLFQQPQKPLNMQFKQNKQINTVATLEQEKSETSQQQIQSKSYIFSKKEEIKDIKKDCCEIEAIKDIKIYCCKHEEIKHIKVENSEIQQFQNTIEIENVDNENEIIKQCIQFQKNDFKNLIIIGQFNKGFIITFLKHKNELFIIDQHASNEKTNYEKLLNNNNFSCQNLIKPIVLYLQPYEIQLIEQNLDIFYQNGFKFQIIDQKVLLNCIPTQQYNINFTENDFLEILFNISQDITGKFFRPKSIRKVLAMKACRMSIKIGDKLDNQQMRSILDGMSELQSPWNCPHGRPTMINPQDSLIKIINLIQYKRNYYL